MSRNRRKVDRKCSGSSLMGIAEARAVRAANAHSCRARLAIVPVRAPSSRVWATSNESCLKCRKLSENACAARVDLGELDVFVAGWGTWVPSLFTWVSPFDGVHLAEVPSKGYFCLSSHRPARWPLQHPGPSCGTFLWSSARSTESVNASGAILGSTVIYRTRC